MTLRWTLCSGLGPITIASWTSQTPQDWAGRQGFLRCLDCVHSWCRTRPLSGPSAVPQSSMPAATISDPDQSRVMAKAPPESAPVGISELLDMALPPEFPSSPRSLLQPQSSLQFWSRAPSSVCSSPRASSCACSSRARPGLQGPNFPQYIIIILFWGGQHMSLAIVAEPGTLDKSTKAHSPLSNCYRIMVCFVFVFVPYVPWPSFSLHVLICFFLFSFGPKLFICFQLCFINHLVCSCVLKPCIFLSPSSGVLRHSKLPAWMSFKYYLEFLLLLVPSFPCS